MHLAKVDIYFIVHLTFVLYMHSSWIKCLEIMKYSERDDDKFLEIKTAAKREPLTCQLLDLLP